MEQLLLSIMNKVPCGREGSPHSGLRQQPRTGTSDPSPLLSTCVSSSRVLQPVSGSPVQDRCRYIRAWSSRCHQDGQGLEEMLREQVGDTKESII